MEVTEENDSSPSSPTKSILINSSSFDMEDEIWRGPMRPRANTDPTSPKPRMHVHFNLPDIVVDDCSDNEDGYIDRSRPEEINRDLANTNEGAFLVFASPPRQRSNTCPSTVFRRKPDRPPTPPACDKVNKEGFQKYPSKEKISFSPHRLPKVSEDMQESPKSQERKTIKAGASPQRSRRQWGVRTNSPDIRSSRDMGKHSARQHLGNADSPTSSPRRPHAPKTTNQHRDIIHSTA